MFQNDVFLKCGLAAICFGIAGCVTPLSQEEFRELDPPPGLGVTATTYRVTALGRDHVSIPVTAADMTVLQRDSLRLFKLSDDDGRWELVSESAFDPDRHAVTADVDSGIYRVFGASRIEEIYELQRRVCLRPQTQALVPEICKYVLCPALDPGLTQFDMAGESGFAGVGGSYGGICDECLRSPGGIEPYPECQLPAFNPVPVPFPFPGRLYPWPRRVSDTSDICVSGRYHVGRTEYDFPDALDLIPSGSATPAYSDVDVRAVVRYPAATPGDDTAFAEGRFPLVVFLHGNHVTCSGPCGCSHSCPANQRIKNHTGYDYLLDILASHGIIAVSIDGFDLTCIGASALMTDYEARGRLILHHLAKWQQWDNGSAPPWGNKFQAHVLMQSIGLVGHSRGGEGVVAAEHINRTESQGFNIDAIVAIAPTDQDWNIRYTPEVPYLLLLAARDGDVSNLQGQRTYDRTSLGGALPQVEKSLMWLYGANHNYFNTSWTPGFGEACASDDGSGVGDGALPSEDQRLAACHAITAFMKQHTQGRSEFRSVFQGKESLQGMQGVEHYWAYQDPNRLEVDHFDDGNNRDLNSLGGQVVTSPGLAVFDEFECRPGLGSFNSSFFGSTRCLVLSWNSAGKYETRLPTADANISNYNHLAFRVAAVIGSNVTNNNLDVPKSIQVGLRTTSGQVANVDFPIVGTQTLPYPYEYAFGSKTTLTTVRIPLKNFRVGKSSISLSSIEAITFDLMDEGTLVIDDIQFTR